MARSAADARRYLENACRAEHVIPWAGHLHKGRDSAIRAYVELCTKFGGELNIAKGLWIIADYRPTGRTDDTWYLCFDLVVREGATKVSLGRIRRLYTSDNVLTMELDSMLVELTMDGLKEAKREWTSGAPSRR